MQLFARYHNPNIDKLEKRENGELDRPTRCRNGNAGRLANPG